LFGKYAICTPHIFTYHSGIHPTPTDCCLLFWPEEGLHILNRRGLITCGLKQCCEIQE
jgi:hypothetical protein